MSSAAGIAAHCSNTSIIDCHVEGDLSAYGQAGGLVAWAGPNVLFRQCFAKVEADSGEYQEGSAAPA